MVSQYREKDLNLAQRANYCSKWHKLNSLKNLGIGVAAYFEKLEDLVLAEVLIGVVEHLVVDVVDAKGVHFKVKILLLSLH